MDRFVNYIYELVQGIPNTIFIIIMGTLVALGFYFFSLFLKANKKDSSKLVKPSHLLMAIFIIAVIVILTNIRN